MTGGQQGRPRSVSVRREALDDLRSLNVRRPAVAQEVLRLLRGLESGTVRPRRLRDFSKTGDLRDCGKIQVVVPDHPEHRIVVREREANHFEVVEVLVIEERSDDLAYLLAGLRLGRIPDPVRGSDLQRRIARIIAARERTTGQPPT